MRQLVEGLEYLHRHDIIHRYFPLKVLGQVHANIDTRDIKMSNLLLTAHGILKIGKFGHHSLRNNELTPTADFGMAREYSPRPLTPGVVTVWYRAPELLLSANRYNPSVDIWSAGCIMGELILQMPLLPGETETEQFSLIVKLIGSPNDKIWPKMRLLPGIYEKSAGNRGRYYNPPVGAQSENMLERRLKSQSKETIRLINEMLTYDPDRRITAGEALRHKYFTREMPPAQRPELIQTFPEIRNERSDDGGHHAKGSEGLGKRKAKDAGGPYVFDFPDNGFVESLDGGKKRRRNKDRGE